MSKVITLDGNTESVICLCKKDKHLSKVIEMVGPIVYVLHDDDPYTFLVHGIIEQMLSIKASTKIYGRLEELCSGRVTVDAINYLTDEQIKSIGTSSSKVGYIRSLTSAIESGSILFTELKEMTDDHVIKKLTTVRGIGTWSAKMYLIFVLNRQDVLPTEDVAFLQSYEWLYKAKDRSVESVRGKCKKWKPYSSIAARYLYRALDMGLTKEEFFI